MAGNPEDDKLNGLEARIHAAEDKPSVRNDEMAQGKAWVMGRAGFDFIATVIASGFLGWCVDYFGNTGPWGILVGIVAGFGFGMRNVWRVLDEKGKRD